MTLKDADTISPSIFLQFGIFNSKNIFLGFQWMLNMQPIRNSKAPDRRSAIEMIGLRTEATSEHQTWAVVSSAPVLVD
jgi:hypothetical protein